MTRDWDIRADELSRAAIAAGEPTAWFDRLYGEGAAGRVSVPWDRSEPQVNLRDWAESSDLDGTGRRAVVVGCGLGADAEFLSRRGFSTTAFDIAPNAIELARSRNPGTTVDYRVANLLSLPVEFGRAFDLVVEIFTIQALPDPPRAAAIAAVAGLVADGGTLLAVAFRHTGVEPRDQGPPFPLTRSDMESLAREGLSVVSIEEVDGNRWRAEYRRPAPA